MRIRVPSPPKLVPTISAGTLLEKPDSKSAAGTLLMTWEARTLMRISRPESAAESQEAKAGILPRFPMKIKNARNVASRE